MARSTAGARRAVLRVRAVSLLRPRSISPVFESVQDPLVAAEFALALFNRKLLQLCSIYSRSVYNNQVCFA